MFEKLKQFQLIALDCLQLVLQLLFSLGFAVVFSYDKRGELAVIQITMAILSIFLQFGGGGFYLRERKHYSSVSCVNTAIVIYGLMSVFSSFIFAILIFFELIGLKELLILSGAVYLSIGAVLQLHYRVLQHFVFYAITTNLRMALYLLYLVYVSAFSHVAPSSTNAFLTLAAIDFLVILVMAASYWRDFTFPGLKMLRAFISFGIVFLPHKVAKSVYAELDSIVVSIVAGQVPLGQFAILKSIYKFVPALSKIINYRQAVMYSNAYKANFVDGDHLKKKLVKIGNPFYFAALGVMVACLGFLFVMPSVAALFELDQTFIIYLMSITPLTIFYYPLYNLTFYEGKLSSKVGRMIGIALSLLVTSALYVIGVRDIYAYFIILIMVEVVVQILFLRDINQNLSRFQKIVLLLALGYIFFVLLGILL